MKDDLSAARGIINGLLISLVFWLVFFFVVTSL